VLALARHPHAAHRRACLSRAPCLLNSRRGCACNKITRPSAPASALVQAWGGAVAVGKGELVFDGVAISDTSATVRRPSAARAGRPLRLWARAACAGPVPCAGIRRRNLHGRWRRHVPREQHDHKHAGGAPGPAQSFARTHLRYWFAVVILELARVLDRVPSRQPVEQE
jgi:hypothetical protein